MSKRVLVSRDKNFTIDAADSAGPTLSQVPLSSKASFEELVETVRKHIVGETSTIRTAFGDKPLVYADNTASGRSIRFIEDFLLEHVMPLYANTHTTASLTGRQSTAFRQVLPAFSHPNVFYS